RLISEAPRRLIRFGELVGEHQRRQHEQPRLAGLADLTCEPRDLAVDEARQIADPILFPLIARDGVGSAINGDGHLRHHSSSSRWMRRIASSSLAATAAVVSAIAAAFLAPGLTSPTRFDAVSSRCTA